MVAAAVRHAPRIHQYAGAWTPALVADQVGAQMRSAAETPMAATGTAIIIVQEQRALTAQH